MLPQTFTPRSTPCWGNASSCCTSRVAPSSSCSRPPRSSSAQHVSDSRVCAIALNKFGLCSVPAAHLQTVQTVLTQCTTSGRQCTSETVSGTAADISGLKSKLYASVAGIDRGIFGAKSDKRNEVHALLEQLEALNPTTSPTEHLQQVAGRWKLVYSTISITGSRKTKLGLRGFIKLGDLFQTIDIENQLAVNEVQFSVSGLGTFSGDLRIEASYDVASRSRVNVLFRRAELQPSALQKLFQKNYDLLLSIFNPEGWLEITYVDQDVRIGRDDKQNIFLLERA